MGRAGEGYPLPLHLFGSRGPREDRHDPALKPSGDVDLVISTDVDVHLAPDPEFGQIDPRLDREAGAREDQALVVGFQVVHVGAIAVGLLADVMPRPVDEVGSVARLLDDPTRGGIDLPSAEEYRSTQPLRVEDAMRPAAPEQDLDAAPRVYPDVTLDAALRLLAEHELLRVANRAELTRLIERAFAPMSAAETQAAVDRLFATPASVVARIEKALSP